MNINILLDFLLFAWQFLRPLHIFPKPKGIFSAKYLQLGDFCATKVDLDPDYG